VHILLIFIDGIGLGDDTPDQNPFAIAQTPTLHRLSGGHRWLRDTELQQTDRALFIPTDANLGVAGRPQSGTGQATIVTGRNIPQIVGQHYGPKPDEATRALIHEGTIFSELIAAGKSADMLEAYPPPWHDGINSGKRLPASYQQASKEAGIRFYGADDLRKKDALSGDWTGVGWHEQLGISNIPQLSPYDAGVRLVELSRRVDFAFMPHWLTDVVGHRGPLERGITLLETFDEVMRGVVATWHDDEGVVIITSDHGNMEDLSIRQHTRNPVPTVIIGDAKDRFLDLHDLTGFVPRIYDLILGN
jgi:2,3-bisphosphoglycerate-independent phosphoglycerate mutase